MASLRECKRLRRIDVVPDPGASPGQPKDHLPEGLLYALAQVPSLETLNLGNVEIPLEVLAKIGEINPRLEVRSYAVKPGGYLSP